MGPCSRQYLYHFMVLFWLLVLVFSVFSGTVSARAAKEGQNRDDRTVIELIRLRHRPAGEVLAAVQAALSPAGRASVDRVGNGIIAVDTPERMEQLRSLVHRLDVRVPQVTVRLRYRAGEHGGRRLATAGGIRTPRPALRLGSGALARESTLMLRLRSGSTGYLRVGRDIAVTREWIALCSRYGFSYGWLADYRRMETGFQVSALVLDREVDLTLVPRISFGPEHAISFTRAATRLTVPAGTWVPVALQSGSGGDATTFVLTGGSRTAAAMVLEVLCRLDSR